jgi:hypothetical protein
MATVTPALRLVLAHAIVAIRLIYISFIYGEVLRSCKEISGIFERLLKRKGFGYVK